MFNDPSQILVHVLQLLRRLMCPKMVLLNFVRAEVPCFLGPSRVAVQGLIIVTSLASPSPRRISGGSRVAALGLLGPRWSRIRNGLRRIISPLVNRL